MVAAAALPSSAEALAGVIPGAIRFDAWGASQGPYSSLSTVQAFQNYLSPKRWQFRAPWYCKPPSDNQMACDEAQANMDTEIQCAANAGIKFWASNQFTGNSAFGVSYNLYLTSSFNSLVKWCWITDLGTLGSTGNFATQVAGYVANYQQPQWMTVLSGRPLHFIFWNASNFIGHWGSSYANVAAMITALRSASVSAGAGNPYIVVMDFTPAAASTEATGIGADAIGLYNWSAYGAYTGLASAMAAQWPSYSTAANGAGLGFIPTAVTGWDRSPQFQSPAAFAGNSWGLNGAPTPYSGILNVANPGTNSQIATHIGAAGAFVQANPTTCLSTAMLICAWNECSEEGAGATNGGLIPSIGDPPQVGNTSNLLTAVGAVLN